MAIRRMDHLNMMTADVAATVRFYEDVLGLEGRPPPFAADMRRVAWIHDGADVSVLHIVEHAAMRADFGSIGGGPPEGTGRVHHLAFECDDYEGVAARIAGAGYTARTNDVAELRLRQIFVRDPNGLLIELNFREDGAT